MGGDSPRFGEARRDWERRRVSRRSNRCQSPGEGQCSKENGTTAASEFMTRSRGIADGVAGARVDSELGMGDPRMKVLGICQLGGDARDTAFASS